MINLAYVVADDKADVIVDCGAVPPLVRHLQAPPRVSEGDSGPRQYEYGVEKGSAFTLGLIAIKVISLPERNCSLCFHGSFFFLINIDLEMH